MVRSGTKYAAWGSFIYNRPLPSCMASRLASQTKTILTVISVTQASSFDQFAREQRQNT